MLVENSLHVTICVQKGGVLRSNFDVKCGNIMSGFPKCCDFSESRLLCGLLKALTDKTQVFG